jgi:hypothetical protein
MYVEDAKDKLISLSERNMRGEYTNSSEEPGAKDGEMVGRSNVEPASVLRDGEKDEGGWRTVYEGYGLDRFLVRRKGRGEIRYEEAMRERWTGDARDEEREELVRR